MELEPLLNCVRGGGASCQGRSQVLGKERRGHLVKEIQLEVIIRESFWKKMSKKQKPQKGE